MKNQLGRLQREHKICPQLVKSSSISLQGLAKHLLQCNQSIIFFELLLPKLMTYYNRRKLINNYFNEHVFELTMLVLFETAAGYAIFKVGS